MGAYAIYRWDSFVTGQKAKGYSFEEDAQYEKYLKEWAAKKPISGRTGAPLSLSVRLGIFGAKVASLALTPLVMKDDHLLHYNLRIVDNESSSYFHTVVPFVDFVANEALMHYYPESGKDTARETGDTSEWIAFKTRAFHVWVAAAWYHKLDIYSPSAARILEPASTPESDLDDLYFTPFLSYACYFLLTNRPNEAATALETLSFRHFVRPYPGDSQPTFHAGALSATARRTSPYRRSGTRH
jgi:hypothetical protein